MATPRVSRLPKRILSWLVAAHRRPQGGMSMRHDERVKALEGDKGNISPSLRTLEARGGIAMGRTPGGRADYLALTSAGLETASDL